MILDIHEKVAIKVRDRTMVVALNYARTLTLNYFSNRLNSDCWTADKFMCLNDAKSNQHRDILRYSSV